MKKYLLIISNLLCVAGISQITITQADMPNVNDTLRISYALDIVDPVPTGANYTWDFSFLNPAAQWVEKFDDPATFPSIFSFLFNTFNTSYGNAQYTPDSIPLIGIKPDGAYDFLKESSSKYKQVGSGLTINALPIPFYYTKHDTIYRFPLNYGDMDTSDAAFSLPIPNLGTFGQMIHRENVADGWGTLITPYGTFQSLRIKSIITVRDTFTDTSGVGFANTRAPSYEYKWLTQGGKIPYLEIDADEIAGTPVVTNIAYRDSFNPNVPGIGVPEIVGFNLRFAVFPNPAKDYLMIEFSLDEKSDMKIELLDINGRKIHELMKGKRNPGKNLEIIKLPEAKIKSGTYLVKVISGKKEGVKKVSIQ